MAFKDSTIADFNNALSSKAAVPGGGGASAHVGAAGISLAAMVGNLTIGKEKYIDVEPKAYELIDQAITVRDELHRLIDADAKAFEPLAKAYSIPKDDPSRDEILEQCLIDACAVPMDIMRILASAIDIHAEMEQIGSALAISDIGVGVASCKAALQGASLNVYINTKLMKNRVYAESIEKEADEILATYCPKADAVFDAVHAKLRG